MLERFQKLLNELKKKQEEELLPTDMETVQGYFEMEDTNKWLKFNAITQNQLKNTERFEHNLKKVFEKLYVPQNT